MGAGVTCGPRGVPRAAGVAAAVRPCQVLHEGRLMQHVIGALVHGEVSVGEDAAQTRGRHSLPAKMRLA